MKIIANEIGGNIKYDENKKRLIVTVSEIQPDQYKKLVDKLERIVRENKPDDCIWDARNRKAARHELEQYAVQRAKSAMKMSLKRIAIVQPEDEQDKKISDQFVSDMNSDSVRAFENRQEAEQWLDYAEGQRKEAA